MTGIICFFSGIYAIVILFVVRTTLNDPYINTLENEFVLGTYHLKRIDTEFKILKGQQFAIEEWMTWADLYEDFRKKYPYEADKWMENYVGLNWPHDCY